MAEIILPPEENEETPQVPELNIDKPTENSKVITIEFEAKKTNKVSTKDTNQQLYTTDTDAWFEFKETSLEGANGTYSVVFRNRHDGSIFQRTGDVVNGVAYYKIPHQEIRHAGAWRGQIVYTLSNSDTTSREFGYDVKGHILDGKDVREIVVEGFETLMSQLRSMKDSAELELADLKQELENTTDTAEQNETDRQIFFDDLVEDIDELQANYQELLDTGVLQTNINTKLEQLEEEYAPKLTEVTAQLAQTETRKVDKDGSGQVKWANIAQDVREQISGEKVAVVGDDSIITSNLTNQVVKNSKIDNEAVTPRTTSFIKESTNLYNKETVVEGKRLDGNGDIIIDANWTYSERIPVLPGQKYYVKHIGMLLWLTQDGSSTGHVSGVYDTGAGEIITIPDNIYYMIPMVRMNQLANDVQISLGETAIPFEPYYNRLESVQTSYEDVISNLTKQEFEAMQDEFGGKNLVKNSLKLDRQSNNELDTFYFWFDGEDIFTEKLQEGVTYTLSFDLKATVPTSSDRVYLNESLIIGKHFDLPIEWKRQYVTFKYNGGVLSNGTQIRPTFFPESSGYSFVRRIKLVKGIDENITYRPSPSEYSAVLQIDVDSYKEEIIESELKRIEENVGNDIPVSEMYKAKQPKGMLGAWTEINGAGGLILERITVGYDNNLYFHIDSQVFKLEDLNGTRETGVNLSGLGMGSVQMMAVFPSGVVYVTNNTDEDNEPCAQVWKAPDYETEPTLLHTLKGDRTVSLATKAQYNGVQEVITICQYSHDVFRDNSAFVSFDGGETIKKVKTVQGVSSSSGANIHYHTMHWDFYQNRLWLGEGDTATNRSIWYSDDIGETWDRINSSEHQPTAIESFPNRVIFGRDNYAHLPGFWSFERPKTHDDLDKEIKLVDRLSFETEPKSTAITYYPERMGFAQDGLVAYQSFERQVTQAIPTYIYATGDGGLSWHCVLIAHDETRGAFIKDGYLIALRRADSQLIKTPLLEWE